LAQLDKIYRESFPKIHCDIPSPCFVLEEQRLVENLQFLKKVREEAGIELICALKGFALHSAFPLIRQYLSGGSASSLHEARLIHDGMGVKAHTYCPVYVPSDFEELLSLSTCMTFNSIGEWERYRELARSSGVSVGLRVNPGYSEIETRLYDPADPASRLGLGPEVLKDGLPEGIDGLHFHVLCENDSFTLERVLESLETGFEKALHSCKWVN